jgi:hypothetical protein
MDNMNASMTNIAIVAFFITLAIATVLYFRPRLLMTAEGFTTIAIDAVTAPKCFLRDANAQKLITKFADIKRNASPNCPKAMALAELTQILQKALCIDADLAGAGMGPYSTYQLAYATAHDIEPAANFVNRCLRNAVRSRDIEEVMAKFENRGTALLAELEADGEAGALFHDVMLRAGRNISEYCLKEKASLDRPAGVRDPGYYEPPALEQHREYEIVGGGKQWI